MMNLRLPTFIFAFVVALTPAYAQWQVDSGAVPLGRGVGQTGFNKVAGASGAGTKCLTDTTPPSFTTCGSSLPTIANNTLLANTSGSSAAPVQTTPGGLWDSFCSTGIGQSWVRLSGGWGCTSLGYANPVWWGCDATGVASCTSAFNSANATGMPVRFPPGIFNITATITVNQTNWRDNFVLSGAGKNKTKLLWTAGSGGLAINCSASGSTIGYSEGSFTISDLTIATTQVGPGRALDAGCAAGNSGTGSVIRSVLIQGDDFEPYRGSAYWSNGIRIRAWSFINIEDVNINGRSGLTPGGPALGNGIFVEGMSAGSLYAIHIRLSDVAVSATSIGLVLGDYWQGVIASNVVFGSHDYCIYQSPGASGVLAGLQLSNWTCDVDGSGVVVTSPISNISSVNGNVIYRDSSGTGLALGTSTGAMITTTNIASTTAPISSNSISVGGGVNVIIGNALVGATTGILFTGTSFNNVAGLNTYSGITNKIFNAGTNNSIGTAAAGNMTGVVP